MNIRQKLTYRFAAIVAAILLVSFLVIYLFSSLHRKHEYNNRLKAKAISTAQFLIEQDEVDTTILKIIDHQNLGALFSEKVVIYNYLNQVVYSTDEDNIIQVSPDVLNQVRLDGEVQFSRGNFEVAGVPYIDQYNRFIVFTAAYDIYGVSKLRNLRIILITVFFSSILIVLLSGWVYAGRALYPMAKVVDQVRTITAHNLHVRVDEGNQKDEIAQLSKTFNSMLSRLEGAFALQKMFVSNASHELRNPLTVVSSQLEVSLLKERSAEDYQCTIASVLEDIRKLSRTLNRLLALAQISAEEARLKRSRQRIDDLLWQCRDELLRQYPHYQIKIALMSLPEEEEQLYLSVDKYMVKMAFINLMDNACKFSVDHQVTVTLWVEKNQAKVKFTDQGPGITPEDLPRIFEPFFRSSQTTAAKGQGIGLSIVDRIIKLHDASLDVRSQVGKGTTIEVIFPTSKEVLSPV
ncbi:MAG: ATP-binding protein [Bacteroidota bacterium]